MTDTSTSQRSLFRAESLRGRELAWQGRAVLALGLPTGVTTVSSVALAAAAVALIMFGGYSRRVDMDGTVLPSTGVIAISAPSPGRIEMLAVQEGETVEKGATLYTLDLDTATKDGATQQRIIDAQIGGREMIKREIERKARMSEETERELREKIEALKSQKNQVREQITIQNGLVTKLANDYAQFSRLAERHIVALSELNTRQQAWMQGLARLQDLETNNIRLQGELKEAQYQLATTAHTRTDENDALKTKILEIEEKLANSEAHRLIEIRAPEDGVVTAIVAHVGQTVGAGSPMLKIVPRHAPMQAELLARRVLGHCRGHLAGCDEC
jgi:membrane fusion protein